jgi:hypothetical protein
MELEAMVEGTGEIVRSRVGLNLAGIQAYAKVRARCDLLRLQREERLKQLAHQDEQLVAVNAQIALHEATIAGVEAELADAFDDEVRLAMAAPITLDAGVVRVTWLKPTERWTQKVKPEVIARDEPELAARLGIEQKTDKPRAPIITIRPEKVHCV